MHTGPLLGHGLDHVQEEEPPGLVLAQGLEPLLYLLERREAQVRAACTGPGPRQGSEKWTEKAGLGEGG